jgi:hypothetical protein
MTLTSGSRLSVAEREGGGRELGRWEVNGASEGDGPAA